MYLNQMDYLNDDGELTDYEVVSPRKLNLAEMIWHKLTSEDGDGYVYAREDVDRFIEAYAPWQPIATKLRQPGHVPDAPVEIPAYLAELDLRSRK